MRRTMPKVIKEGVCPECGKRLHEKGLCRCECGVLVDPRYDRAFLGHRVSKEPTGSPAIYGPLLPASDTRESGENELVVQAREYATTLHKGQMDFNGPEYITHCQRVAGNFSDPIKCAIGWLHDVVEDTGATQEDIHTGFPIEVADAIQCLTKYSGEDYFEYIKRVQSNPLSVAVKLADLKDNMDVTRFHRPLKQRDIDRLEKYRRAYHILYNPQPQQESESGE